MPSENSLPTEGVCGGCESYGCPDCDPAPTWLFFSKGKAWAVGGDSPTPVELSVDERRSATAHAAEDPAVRYEDEEPRACNCERPEGFTLAVETGGISVVHTACGKQPWFMFNDWTESIEMAPTPVNVDVVTACGPSDHYFEWGVCDCGPEITLTLPPDATAKEVC